MPRLPHRSLRRLPAAAAALALLVLAACGGPGAPPLDDTAHWRAKFAASDNDAIAYVGRRGAAAAPLLSNLLRDPDETVVAAAAMSAGRLGEAGEACLPALFDALRRFPDQPSVIQTVRALPGKLEPFLVRWLEGSDLAEQKQAARLVLYTGAQNPGTLGPLMRILERDGPDDLKELAIGAIGTIGVPADPAIPLLESYVARGGELGTYAARTIKMIASAHKIQEIREEEAAEAEQKKREAAGGN